MSVTSSIEKKLENKIKLLMQEKMTCTDEKRYEEIDLELEKAWRKMDGLEDWVFDFIMNKDYGVK
jgi:hypothetical protein